MRVTFGEQPVEGAGVRALGPDDPITFDAAKWEPHALTDAAGVASVDAPAGGRVLVYVPGHELFVAPAQGTTVDVALRPERTFTGRLVDTKGDGVPGAEVALRTTFNREATFLARSDGEGAFHVYGLWFDNYTLAIAADGFVDPEPARVTGADTDGRAVTLVRTGAVAGRVMDASGKPRGRSVVLVGLQRVRTDEEGLFVAKDLPPGDLRIRTAPPWGGELRFALEEGATVTGLQLLARPPGRLRFRTVDADGEPIPNVLVRHEPEARTDGKGVVELAVTPGETTHVVLESTHGFEHDFPPVESGEVLDAGDVVLDPPPVIEVRVWLPNGAPAPEGRIDDEPLRDGAAKTQGQDQVWAFVPGYPETLVRIAPPGPVDVRLPVPQWIRGIVLDPAGAPVAGAAIEGRGEKAESDEEGRFRLGPFAPDDEVQVIARAGDLRSRGHMVVGFEGELEVRLIEREPEFVRGRVLRGDGPVRRFAIGGREFVDEEGRFEVLVDRTRTSSVAILVDRRTFSFALRAPGEDLVATLPSGVVTVHAPGPIDREVVLRTPAGSDAASAITENGTAYFRDVEPGSYAVIASDFAEAQVAVTPDRPVDVTLTPEPHGTLRVGDKTVKLRAGWHESVTVRPDLEVTGFAIAPGEDVRLDLAPANAGSLLVTGPAGRGLSIAGEAGVRFVLHAALGDSGEHLFERLPPGRYRVGLATLDRDVEVAPGRLAVARLGDVEDLRGRVMLLDGRPAQGAEVHFASPRGKPFYAARTDLLGRFVLEDVPLGEYELRASLAGHAPAIAPATDGAVLVLEPGTHGTARLIGRLGEPLAHVALLVDGVWQRTDGLGSFVVQRTPARVSLDLEGYASVREIPVESGSDVRLVPGALLRVLHADDPERVQVRVAGAAWRPLREPVGRPAPDGEIRIEDLPAVPVEVEVEPAEEGAESRVVRARLVSGEVTIIDLR